ncbi:MAG: bacteriophage abortive infection AbiH family protein [Lachnospiraceae bacterium]|nr:bacteriophage abortive infection AbiH family protein [Lachnospiraceae bacterium]
MNILIIGNGFDLAHDLPTKYENFLDFTNVYLGKTCFDSEYIDSFREYFERIKQTAPSVYEEIGSLIKDNVWLEHFNAVYEERRKDGKIGWIDFESEISNIVQEFDAIRLEMLVNIKNDQEVTYLKPYRLDKLESFFIDGEEPEILEGIVEIKKQMLKDLNRLTRCLEIYLSDYINNLPVSTKLPDIAGLKVDKVLSFNYTNTYERLYGKDYPHIEYDYIHGKADINHDINGCQLVLGIDEYLPEGEKDKNIEFIQFKKFYQRIYKKTGCKYLDWINGYIARLNDTRRNKFNTVIEDFNIYVFGHSLDITDEDVLSKLILTKYAKTTIFHLNQKALGKQITNLVKVIGQDNLISMVHGKHARIVLQQQQDAVDM